MLLKYQQVLKQEKSLMIFLYEKLNGYMK